jgi:hypothetical protein
MNVASSCKYCFIRFSCMDGVSYCCEWYKVGCVKRFIEAQIRKADYKSVVSRPSDQLTTNDASPLFLSYQALFISCGGGGPTRVFSFWIHRSSHWEEDRGALNVLDVYQCSKSGSVTTVDLLLRTPHF